MRLKLAGGEPEIVTKDPGGHRAAVSPDGAFVVDTWTSLTTPTRIVLRRGDGSVVRAIADAASAPGFARVAWGRAELFTIPSSDGKFQLPAWWVLPPDFSPKRQYPVIFTIYGGPDAGTVQNVWPSLSAHYWAQRGVITISVDHRGSGHFGKAGTALMHRQLGTWEMTDLSTAAAWLRTQAVRPGRSHRHHRVELRRLHDGDGDDEGRRPVQLRDRRVVGDRLAAVRLGLHRALHGSAVARTPRATRRARC